MTNPSSQIPRSNLVPRSKLVRRSDLFWLMLVATGVLLQFWWLPGTVQPADDSYSNSVDGKLGFFRVVENVFPHVDRQRDKLVPDELSVLVMIAPERYPNDREQKQILEFVEDGGALVFAPNWRITDFEADQFGFALETLPDWEIDEFKFDSDPDSGTGSDSNDGSNEKDKDASETDGETEVEEGGENDRPSPGLSADKVYSPLTGESFTVRSRSKLTGLPMYCDELAISERKGDELVYAASWYYGDGVIVACSSSDVFSNLSLTNEKRGLFAIKLIEHAFEKSSLDRRLDDVTVSEFYNVASNYRYSGILFSPALRSSTLQMMVIGVLFGWYSYHRFGPPARVTTTRRRTLEESAEAVGNMLYRSSDGGTAVRNYLDYVTSRLRREYGASGTLNNFELLVARSGLPAGEIRSRLADCRAQAAAQGVTSSDAANSIRWLTRLLDGTKRTNKNK